MLSPKDMREAIASGFYLFCEIKSKFEEAQGEASREAKDPLVLVSSPERRNLSGVR